MRPIWRGAPARADLAAGEVAVWRARLDVTARQHEANLALLDDEERARCARFISPQVRRRWAAARAALRRILATHLRAHNHDVNAAALSFEAGEFGKPSLEPATRERGLDLRFSLSHSADRALVALCVGEELGADVEAREARARMLATARYAFSPAEVEALEALPEARQLAAFYRIWTRKEAYIKALGLGLHLDLASFEVDHADVDTPRILAARHEGARPARWQLRSFEVDTGYQGAAMIPRGYELTQWWELTSGG